MLVWDFQQVFDLLDFEGVLFSRQGFVAVTRSLDVKFKKFISINSTVLFSTKIIEETEKDLVGEVELTSADNVVHCTAKGTYFKYRKVSELQLKMQDEMFDFPRDKYKRSKL